MTAETLRRAAALMRERAQAATPGPWVTTGKADRYGGLVSLAAPADEDEIDGYGGTLIGETLRRDNRAHIAAWHPAVALAVADWLDLVARLLSEGFDANAESAAALNVARAYLGESA